MTNQAYAAIEKAAAEAAKRAREAAAARAEEAAAAQASADAEKHKAAQRATAAQVADEKVATAQKVVKPDAPEELEEVVDFG